MSGNSDLKREFKSKIAPRVEKIKSLKQQKDALEREMKDYDEQHTSIESKMGLREKYMWGFFGGNKDQIHAARDIAGKYYANEKQLNITNPELEKVQKALYDDIKSFLRENDESYSNQRAELLSINKLINVFADFITIVRNAQKGIKDAIYWLGWEKLTKHPEAQLRLHQFKEKVQKVDQTITIFDLNKHGYNKDFSTFLSLIKYDSEKETLKSFECMLLQAHAINSFINEKRKKLIEELDKIVEEMII